MSAPLRFLAVTLTLWIGARAAMLVPAAERAAGHAPAPVRALLGVAPAAAAAPAQRAQVAAVMEPQRSPVAAPRAPKPVVLMVIPVEGTIAPAPAREDAGLSPGTRLLLAAAMGTRRRVDLGQPQGLAPAPLPASADAGGWSGDAYLFARGGGRPGLAPGAQLGGGQAFARVSRRVGVGVAATVRAARALSSEDAEAAAGVSWRPDGALPLGITVERRVGLEAGGRDAWAAFAAGGADAVPLARDLRLDAYAQAGVVGARTRAGFVDGAARIGRRQGPVHVGAGVWGAAQPGAARVDLGPQAAMRFRIGGVAATAALDWRFRVAGGAVPGDGVALTLAAGF